MYILLFIIIIVLIILILFLYSSLVLAKIADESSLDKKNML